MLSTHRGRNWKKSHFARRGRARHLVLLGAVAVLDARLAGQDAGVEALLSDLGAGHRLRHHLLLGRPHDDDGAAFHEARCRSHDVYIHRLVRDASGAKMSKSKGNVVDPLGVIDQYGADALRFTLARGAAQGHDIRLGPQDVENNRNFATKLWNAARFAEMNECATVAGFDPGPAKETLNRWITQETARAAARDHEAIERLPIQRRGGRGLSIRLELLLRLVFGVRQADASRRRQRRERRNAGKAAWARDEIFKLLHPFMPFITEELWRVTAAGRRSATIIARRFADWPSRQARLTTRPKRRSAG